MKASNNKILITGGATGIGFGLTERFVKDHNKVIICGRREPVLQDVVNKFPSVVPIVCDLSTEEGRVELFNWVSKNHPDLNVLVNNAGVQYWMDIADERFLEKADNEIETNITAPVQLISMFSNLKSLDTIMNVTSGLAFIPLAKIPVYSATKAFMRSFTLSLRHSLKSRNIEVIEIIPPALNTDLGGKGIHDAYPPVSEFIESIFEQLKAGKNELTFETSAIRANANNKEIQEWFSRMNP